MAQQPEEDGQAARGLQHRAEGHEHHMTCSTQGGQGPMALGWDEMGLLGPWAGAGGGPGGDPPCITPTGAFRALELNAWAKSRGLHPRKNETCLQKTSFPLLSKGKALEVLVGSSAASVSPVSSTIMHAPSTVSGGVLGCAEAANPSTAALVRPVCSQHSPRRRGQLLPTPNLRHPELCTQRCGRLADHPTCSPGPTGQSRQQEPQRETLRQLLQRSPRKAGSDARHSCCCEKRGSTHWAAAAAATVTEAQETKARVLCGEGTSCPCACPTNAGSS